ncbi:MAG: MFS transporter [Actinomycetota bacterium]|nr:MFS transporter [Actinomycetota bacterium]
MTLFEGENRSEKVVVLFTMVFALFMAMLDNTVVNVALPRLSHDLGAGVSGLQWIVDGYVLALASLLLTGGILGDRFGRKRTFLIGLVTFTFSSLLCGLSQTTGQLIAARGLQGVGAALLLPGTLSIITVTFPPKERAKAIGIWAGVSGLALALGPTVGGWMVEHVGWESVFFLNVPIGIIGTITGLRTIRESRSPQARRLDVGGLLIGTAGLFSLTYALIEANQRGWGDGVIVTTLLAGGVLLAVLVAFEHRSAHPMMPLQLFRIRPFSAGNAVAFSVTLAMFGTFFFMSLYMQQIRGYSPFEAGLRFVPMTGMIIFAAPNAGRLASKYGSRWPMTLGLTLAGAGMLLLSRVNADTPFLLILPVLMMMGIGMGSTMTPMTAAVMNAVGHERAGLGGAMTNTSREVGGVFGIALLGSLLTTKLKSALTVKLGGLGLAAAQKSALIATAGHGRFDPQLLKGFRPETAAAVTNAYSDSFIGGFHLALLVAACVLLFSAGLSYMFIPSGAPHSGEAGEPETLAAVAT